MDTTGFKIAHAPIARWSASAASVIEFRNDAAVAADVVGWRPIRLGIARRSLAPVDRHLYSRKSQMILLVSAILLSVSAVAAAYLIGGESAIMTLGYPGVFLAAMISAASLFIPLPIGSIGIAAGSQMEPPLNLPPFVMIGVAGGIGSAVGEFTGFLAGRAGHCTISESRAGKFIEEKMERWGGIAVFSVAAVPNPFVDVMGIAAGAGGISPGRFFAFVCPGKIINHTITAFVIIEGVTVALTIF